MFATFLELNSSYFSIDKNKELVQLDKIKEIEFVNVRFKYPRANKYSLDNVSFKLKKGDVVAIVGENGAGKSTLIKLLTRLYDIESGEIFINKVPIKLYDIISLRNQIGIMLQDYVKYQLSMRENIGFGDLHCLYKTESIYLAAEKAGIKDIIENLPNGLESQLGNWFSDGTELSVGQWQRVAIARAFLKNADLYILDEPSASLDPISEKKIFNKFFSLVHNKIGIFISHRLSIVKYATKILVLNKGKLVEQGTHNELIKQNGYYSKLYNAQIFQFENRKII